MKHHNKLHQPVLLDEVISVLGPKDQESYLDLTAGYGGHARAILAYTNSFDDAVLVDRDDMALQSLQDLETSGAKLLHMDYLQAAQKLQAEGRQFDLILMDCGVSSPHLDIASRGFSFQQDGPLDMRMDRRQPITAERLVNETPESELADLIYKYGEERQSRRIARAIVESRPLHTTGQLADTIERVLPRRGKTHPATKTFQAIRLKVNEELEILSQTLELIPRLLSQRGRVAIISFHSLEDRIIKQYLQNQSRNGWEAELELINKKPIVASKDELAFNPRARSAKLRAAAKINNQKERG